MSKKSRPLTLIEERLFSYETSFNSCIRTIDRIFDFGLLTRIHELD